MVDYKNLLYNLIDKLSNEQSELIYKIVVELIRAK